MPKRRLGGGNRSDRNRQQEAATNEEYKDLGFGNLIGQENRRLINKDGSFNVVRTGMSWRDIHPFQFLVTISNLQFGLVVIGAYLLFNAVFAGLYMVAGVEQLSEGGSIVGWWNRFALAFFFSVQTFTTVGYGSISPIGLTVNIIAAFEAMTGLLGFALATGIMWGRFTQPSAKIAFSEKAIIAPYQDINSFQFRIANRRKNQLIELEVMVVMMCYEKRGGQYQQVYHSLDLERKQVALFPLSWTIVHPISQESPMYGMDEKALKENRAEFLIVIKGYDETFAQAVHQRMSYRYDEILYGAKFVKIFEATDDGPIKLEIDKIGFCQRAELNDY